MHFIDALLQQNQILAWITLIFSFVVLAKCANVFVDSAVDMAYTFKIPKLIVGIVLVSLATTAPELSVSLISAIRGKPEMALGNAIGSVICDDGLGLALAGILTLTVIPITPMVLKLSGGFLILVQFVLFLFLFPDTTLSRYEGMVLIGLFGGYLYLLISGHKRGKFPMEEESSDTDPVAQRRISVVILLFAAALIGIIGASELIVSSATSIAAAFGIPESIIALTLVALGTSIPEVATCVVAVRKGHGTVAVGNIIGADILNICWVAGASAMANDLSISRRDFNFMFPSMFIMVSAMLGMLWVNKRLSRKKGFVLLALYVIYIASFFVVFR
jgi:cation:H+ antiporter